MGMFQLMHSHFIFLDSVKAILVHCAHRLLSESTLILCTGTRPVEGKRPYDFPGIARFLEIREIMGNKLMREITLK